MFFFFFWGGCLYMWMRRSSCASFVVCVVLRLGCLVQYIVCFSFKSVSFQRQRIKDKETRIIILTAFLSSSSTFIFFLLVGVIVVAPSLSLFQKTLNHRHTHIFFSCVFFLLLFRSLFSLLINEREGKNGNRRRTADQRRRRKQKGWRITRHRCCPGR